MLCISDLFIVLLEYGNCPDLIFSTFQNFACSILCISRDLLPRGSSPCKLTYVLQHLLVVYMQYCVSCCNTSPSMFFFTGLILRYWSPSSRTALAEAELEYHDHKSQAVYVTFPISHPSPELKFALLAAGSKKVSALVWTTTPWTLLANQALAVNPKLGYSLIKLSMSLDDADNNCSRDGTELYVIATGLIDRVTDAIGQSVERVADLSVDALLKSAYRAPLGNTEADPRPILSARCVSDFLPEN